jgi:hypothetical protein
MKTNTCLLNYFVTKVKEKKMANKKIRLGLLVAVLAFCVFFAGCATLTWNSPVTEANTRTALEAALSSAGAQEVAQYTIILNLFETGRATFDGLVVGAVRSGKTIHVLRINNIFTTKVVAYAVN